MAANNPKDAIYHFRASQEAPHTVKQIYQHYTSDLYPDPNVISKWAIFGEKYPTSTPEIYFEFILAYPELYAKACVQSMRAPAPLNDEIRHVRQWLTEDIARKSRTLSEYREKTSDLHDKAPKEFAARHTSLYLRTVRPDKAAKIVEKMELIGAINGMTKTLSINPGLILESNELYVLDDDGMGTKIEDTSVIVNALETFHDISQVAWSFPLSLTPSSIDLTHIYGAMDPMIRSIEISWDGYFPQQLTIRPGDTPVKMASSIDKMSIARIGYGGDFDADGCGIVIMVKYDYKDVLGG